MSRSSAREERRLQRRSGKPEGIPPSATARSRGSWARRLAPPLVIAILGFSAYSNALRGEFVFDDPPRIVEDEFIRDPANYLPGRPGYQAMPNRAVGNLTFALNYQVNGRDVTGYHLVNTLVHILNALLVYALVVLSFRTPWLSGSALASWSRSIALVAGLLFVAHPLQTQAVTYIVQRLTSLATSFYLLAVVLYIRWRLAREAGRHRGFRGVISHLPVACAALLAMKTKEIAFTLPIVAALYDLAFFRTQWRVRLGYLIPLLATLIVIPMTLVRLERPLGETLSDVAEVTRVQTTVSRWDYLATQVPVVVTYLRLLILPIQQNLDHDYPIYRSLLAPRVLWSLVLVLAIWSAAAYLYDVRPLQGRRLDAAARLVAFGVLWFFVALAVESSLIPIVDVIFEHRVYLPSVGFFIAVATALALLAHRVLPVRAAPTVTVAAGLALALVLAAATYRRNQVWDTELSLWSDVVEKSPAKARPHNNLGFALALGGRETEAIGQFREAVRLDPAHVRARNNLGAALAKLGDPREAVLHLREAIRLAPDYADAYYNLGRVRLFQTDGLEEARRAFERAIALRRNYPDAYANLAAADNALGRYGETVRSLEAAGEIVRDQPQARFNLGLAYFMVGNSAGVAREVRALEDLSPPLAAQLRDYVAQHAPTGRGPPPSAPPR